MLREQVEQVVSDYYVSIGVEPNYLTRKAEQVQSRAAMMCALSDSMTATSIANIFGKDHATVLHHKKGHEANLHSWYGYSDKYKMARSMVNVNLRSNTVQCQIDRIEREIDKLKELSGRLRNSIKLIKRDE